MTDDKDSKDRATATWGERHDAPNLAGLPDRWKLKQPLGKGGQAEVWLADDLGLEQSVALKVFRSNLEPEWEERMRREVRIGRDLHHPGLVRVYELVKTADCTAVAMEYVEGRTLATVLVKDPVSISEVIDIAAQLLEVLTHLHENGVVHRDIKPSNILLEPEGRVRLADLGLARPLHGAVDVTRTDRTMGTPAYMSPEQLRGEKVGPSSDLYGLGATLYHVLTGRPPFEGDSGYAIADAHLHLRPKSVREHRSECPYWLARFVERLLEKNPDDRFNSAQAALDALEGRRVGISRRAISWAAGLLGAAVAIASLTMVASSYRGPELHRVEIADAEVVARSGDGRRLWSSEKPNHIAQAVVGDVIGDGEPEVVIGWSTSRAGEKPEDSTFFEVHSNTGEVIRSFSSEGWATTDFPEYTTVWHLKEMTVGNILGQGDELVWGLANPRWYPAVLGISDLRRASDRPVAQLSNAGHLQNMSVTDIDGDGTDEVIAIMVNNPMGFQRVLVTMSARSRLTGEACGAMKSPDIRAFLQARTTTPRGCVSFTPLGSDVLVVEPPRVVDGKIELVIDGEVRRFDGWGNPDDSMLFGSGPEARESYWKDFASECARIRLEPTVDPPFSLDKLRADHSGVLAEANTEVGSYLVAAKALASGGHRENAVTLLRNGTRRHPSERDIPLRLGEQLLIGGERREGRAQIVESVNLSSSGRNHNDQVYLLILDAAVNGDVASYEETRRFVANLSASATTEAMAFLDAAWFFFRGDWSDPRLADVEPGSIHRWVRVLLEWARFELDGDADMALARAEELAATKEIRDLAVILEARVRLAGGEPLAASQRADAALQSLQAQCRIDYEACVWVPLAEWVLGQALRSIDGREDEAEAVLALAAEHAPNTWIASRVTR